MLKGGKVEFRNIHHEYRCGEPILKGVSLTIPPGMKVAIAGPSGSGKTTLLKLLFRLMDPQEGQILIDDQNVREMSVESFREHLGIVPQDCVLFNDSVGNNIRYGKPSASDEEIEDAARFAQIHDIVESFPEGYDTQVGERGLMLSGGERQRVGIARCLLRNPSIVLLDEATSSLDVPTERCLVEAVDKLTHGRTCLIVAHRLSTVEQCDMVAFLDNGAIVEIGSHNDLLARNKSYQRFWEALPRDP